MYQGETRPRKTTTVVVECVSNRNKHFLPPKPRYKRSEAVNFGDAFTLLIYQYLQVQIPAYLQD